VDRIKILLTLLLLLCPMAVGTYRASRADYDVERIAPSAAYRVHLRVFYETAADTIRVRANLPQNETNLSLGARWTDTNLSGADEYRRGGNRILEWWGETEGRGKVETAFTVVSRSVAYDIDPSFRVSGPPSESMLPFLESTEVVQVDDPAIAALAVELAPAGSSSAASLRRIYDYCRSLPGPETAPDTAQQADDALGTLESQAGSELGRVRLFAAVARHQGIPTRLVQGIVLEPGLEIDPATWVEVRLGPTWVPFHPARALFGLVRPPISRSATPWRRPSQCADASSNGATARHRAAGSTSGPRSRNPGSPSTSSALH
jgi:transglutaminase-like putative cysteine protease